VLGHVERDPEAAAIKARVARLEEVLREIAAFVGRLRGGDRPGPTEVLVHWNRARAALAEWDRDLIAYYGDVDRVGPGPEARHLRTALAHVAEQRSRLAELREERDRWEDRVTALRTEIEGVRRERDEVARNADCGAPAVPGSALCIVHKPARNP